MKKTIHVVTALSFCAILVAGGMATALADKRDFSDNENRYLQQLPEASASSVLTAEYTSDLTSFVNDQFVLRDSFVSFKAYLEKLSGKKENNGVYFGKDNYLIEKEPEYNQALLDNNLNAILKLDALGKYDITMALVPTAYEVLQDKLPEFSYQPVQQQVLAYAQQKMTQGSSITFVNPYDTLSTHKEEPIYYRTDHHQTSLGSFYVYQSLGEALGYTPWTLDQFSKQELANDFYGTTWSKATLSSIPPDSVDAYIPKDPASYYVRYLDTNTESDSLYSMKNLEGKDKYTVFLDGNHALMTIDGSVKNGKSVAVFKDSYAHSILPFLANHYEKIHVIDLRYYSFNSVDYLEQNGISDILVFYNVSNFMKDTNLVKLSAFIQ